jgi:uncharacterized membrane protein
MWWWGGYHWWWPGAVLMAVFMVACIVSMALMMGHGRMSACMGGIRGLWGQRPGSGRHQTDTSERILEERLARGEIDIGEYRRIQQTLAEINSPAGSEEHVDSRQ